jgi:N-acetyl-gamma-glutamyl-phosphate reductase
MTHSSVSVAVVGARGYLGRELVRLLAAHPKVGSLTLTSTSEAGKPYGELVPAFRHRRDLVMAPQAKARDADVVFLATDGEEAKKAVHELGDAPALLVDLSRAHRHAAFEKGSGWSYGLSEFFPVAKGTRRIANPGCYPTATMVAAGAALTSGLAADGVLIADGKSGVSGAGAAPRGDLHYPEMNEAVRAYKVLGHDHLGEIRLAANAASNGLGSSGGTKAVRAVRFTPHLVPMSRGLLSTVYLPAKPGVTAEQAKAAYAKAYAGSPFVRLVAEPDTGVVAGSNFADVAIDLDADAGLLVARCAIDNLVKGGSGQAVQNMNLALGYKETEGLTAVGGGP